jgi:D-tyrosyl-tRNA(Tyr) deacylase
MSAVRAVVQRVSQANVSVRGEKVAEIGRGLMVLLGVGEGDGEEDADYLAGKIAGLRIFDDAQGRLNLSVLDIGGSVLLVSQFTLYGDCRKGRRPSFIRAAPPDEANTLYELAAERLRSRGLEVETGRFQEEMQVALVNDGPVTLILESIRDHSEL